MPDSPPFSASMEHNGFVFTSGQIALHPESTLEPGGLKPVSDDFERQAHASLDQLDRVLEEAGSSLKQTLRLECYIADRRYLGAWHTVFMERFSEPRPARTTVIAQTPVDGVLIEVQAIARK